MALKEQITEDMKTAMRAKDMERLGTIRLLLASIKQKEVDEQTTLDDNAVIAVLDKMLKQRKDSIVAFEQADRDDLAAKEKAEVAVLQAYLPARLSAEEVAAVVQTLVADVAAELGRAPGAADMGKLMAAAKAALAGKAEMAQVSAAVKAALAG
ncbi:GatB/YqeY domain-containing protein [Malikia spinosa]|uniref:GatB/YqeY domain-containing protein n=1 Tax=Malikia spinosa TaxID=86180 RepID=A0A7C9IZI4_9BURK|nr:GatB/YqeY domain-containing protein [Malikia spinosa]MYZ53347.1 GatB/YqeY domain-containing protein [Malikia spinosa]